MRVGIDAQFATYVPRAGLFVHHFELVRALRDQGVQVSLFLNAWNMHQPAPETTRAEVSAAFNGVPTHIVAVPGKLQSLRMWLSPLGRLDVFYHVFGGTFAPIPNVANVFLVPDLIPLVVDYPVQGLRERSSAYYRKALEHGDILMVYSEHTKRDLIERLGARPERIAVVPLAAGDQFHPVIDAGELRDQLAKIGVGSGPYVLAVGTLEVRKNIEVLVRAFARVKREVPALPHKLVLCGAKWAGHEPIFAAIDEEGIAADVIYVPFADRIEYLYSGASLFVFPSIYEGFGLPPLEAMACGVPVVAANATSIPEVTGTAALLFDPADVGELAMAMRRVLLDPELSGTLRTAGIERARQFTWSKTADLTKKAFDRAVQNRQHRRA